MGLNVTALRESFDLVIEREPELTKRFYEILFERYPQVKPLFDETKQAEQQKMLAGALVAVLDHLEDPPWLEQHLAGLGARHVVYGVTPRMYDFVGECLVATLMEVAGDDWLPAYGTAWAEAYSAIRNLMLAGASEWESLEAERAAKTKPAKPKRARS